MSDQRRRLRVGVLVDTEAVPRWAYEALQLIRDSAHSEIVVIVRSDHGRRAMDQSLIARLWDRRYHLLYAAFTRFDSMLSHLSDDPLRPEELSGLLPDIPTLVVRPINIGHTERFGSEDLSAIRSADLDVLIRLGSGILRGDVLRVARCGVWSFHHGDDRTHRGLPAGVWEVLNASPVTGAILQILTDELDGGLVLSRSLAQTDRTFIHRSLATVYWKSSRALERELGRLHRLGQTEFLERARRRDPYPRFYSRRLNTTPTNSELFLRVLVHYGKTAFRKLSDALHFEQWVLFTRMHRRAEMSLALWRFAKVTPPRGRFWADPCVVEHDGAHYIFIEEFVHDLRKGHIACLKVDNDGMVSRSERVLERPYHLSYPFVLHHNGEFYMIPETADNHSIEIYVCAEFPNRWEHVMDLMTGVTAVDTTVLHFAGRWWLFTNIREHRGGSTLDELFLYSSTDLFTTQWTPHPDNPVVSDVQRARSAGRIFEYRGDFYRPSQDSSLRYGHSIQLNRITRLAEDAYEEIPATRITPEWDTEIVATHTLAYAGRLTVIDGLRRGWKWQS